MRLPAIVLTLLVAGAVGARSTPAYDGPVGVTLVAPWIDRNAGHDVRIERLTIDTVAALDRAWTPEQAAGRAFPTGFVPTRATTLVTLRLAHAGGDGARARLLLPFRTSAEPGTGFVAPDTLSVRHQGRWLVAGPATVLERTGLAAVRGYPVEIVVPREGTTEVEIGVTHALALNPAWYAIEITRPPRGMPAAAVRPATDPYTAVTVSLRTADLTLGQRTARVRICAGAPARCAFHDARLGELGPEWFAARAPASGLTLVQVQLDPRGPTP